MKKIFSQKLFFNHKKYIIQALEAKKFYCVVVVDSPSRRYIQRPSDSNVSTFSDTNTMNSQNGSYRSFGNVYEWPSMELTQANDFDEKNSSADYSFCSSFPVSEDNFLAPILEIRRTVRKWGRYRM